MLEAAGEGRVDRESDNCLSTVVCHDQETS